MGWIHTLIMFTQNICNVLRFWIVIKSHRDNSTGKFMSKELIHPVKVSIPAASWPGRRWLTRNPQRQPWSQWGHGTSSTQRQARERLLSTKGLCTWPLLSSRSQVLIIRGVEGGENWWIKVLWAQIAGTRRAKHL